ncbi:unnamed protein product [Gongylonema pulchrum]|uniref:Uncharacterized protein n=1 Tax=Gongylonema pulchrum TaxID=637853 RepID=A0A183E828_9BILA|nr:unnamed protein product [Gongylonema pulchrum]
MSNVPNQKYRRAAAIILVSSGRKGQASGSKSHRVLPIAAALPNPPPRLPRRTPKYSPVADRHLVLDR